FGGFYQLLDLLKISPKTFWSPVGEIRKFRPAELDYLSARKLVWLTFKGVEETKKECERRLAIMKAEDVKFNLDLRARFQIIESLELESGAYQEELYACVTESLVKFLDVLSQSYTDVLSQRLLLVPKSCVRFGEGWSEGEPYDFRHVVDLSKIVF